MSDYRDRISGLSSIHMSSDADRDSPSPTESQMFASDELVELASLTLDQPCGPCRKVASKKVFAAGYFCQDCDEYFCKTCKTDHDKLKITKRHKVTEIQQVCGQCDRESEQSGAKWYCIDCDEHLCNNCRSLHKKFKATEKHQVVNSEEMREWVDDKTKPLGQGGKVEAAHQKLQASTKDKVKAEKPLSKRGAGLTFAFHVRVSDDKEVPSINSSAFLSDGRLLLVDYRNKKLKRFDGLFYFVDEMKFDDDPLRVAVYTKHEVALTIDKGMIARLSVAEDIVVKKKLSLGVDCVGVDYINEKKLAVAGYDTNLLYVVSIDGEMLSKVSVNDASNKFLDTPNNLIVNRTRSRIFISSFAGSAVCALDLTPHCAVKFTYKHKDLSGPFGTTEDHEGNIYICAKRSDNVHQISQDGKLIKVLLTAKDCLHWPQTISFTPSGEKFIIGSGSEYFGGIVQGYTLQ